MNSPLGNGASRCSCFIITDENCFIVTPSSSCRESSKGLSQALPIPSYLLNEFLLITDGQSPTAFNLVIPVWLLIQCRVQWGYQ